MTGLGIEAASFRNGLPHESVLEMRILTGGGEVVTATPDGELTGSGDIVRVMEDEGFEVRHHENLHEHYARTCAAWNANLAKHWDDCVEIAGLGTARVWGLYLAGSRLGFERNDIQLHQVLACRTSSDGVSGLPLRPRFEPADG